MFSSCSSSLLSSLFSSSSPIFPSAAPFPSNLAFVVPSSASSSSSVPSSALSDVFHTLSLQLLLDQHRNSLLRSILSLTSTVPVSDSFYSNPNDYTQKDESLVKEEEETEQGTAGGAEWRKLEEEKTETEIRRGKKRKGRDRGEMAEERRPRGDGAKRTRNDPSKRRVFRPQKGEAETDSPVSGMFIKEFCDEEELRQATAELDESAQFVHVTEETREAISVIPNVIGDSICALCKIRFVDVFRLAMHKCPRIRHAEYRCDECEKVFSCPANLASHRRWHRPSGKKPYEQFAEFTRQKKGKTKAKSGRENGKRQKRERHWAQAEKTTESQTPAATFKF